MAPATNVSYVTQWQVWHKPFVHEMLDEIEQRAPAHVRWPVAIVNAAIDSGHELGFSEYTLYATWLLARHAGEVKLVSSREFPWLRNPPSGVIDKNGDCCPSDESLCQVCIPVLPPTHPRTPMSLYLRCRSASAASTLCRGSACTPPRSSGRASPLFHANAASSTSRLARRRRQAAAASSTSRLARRRRQAAAVSSTSRLARRHRLAAAVSSTSRLAPRRRQAAAASSTSRPAPRRRQAAATAG